jgi:HEAT repeat protein
MRWILTVTLGIGIAAALSSAAVAQDAGHLESLLTTLGDAKTAKDARSELRTLAAGDPHSRQYVAQRLPALIAAASKGDLQLWISSLQLTADLKAAEAVPILTEYLRYDNRFGPSSFGTDFNLYDDPVAKALSAIGEPATQSVVKLFEDGDPATRRRAAIVLGNIATPQARQALLSQIQIEQVDDLRAVMQDQVAFIDKKTK